MLHQSCWARLLLHTVVHTNLPTHRVHPASHTFHTLSQDELRGMAERIGSMRNALFGALQERGVTGDWSFVLKQIGMFSYTGLTREQVRGMGSG